MFYQLSNEATQLGTGQFVGLMCSHERGLMKEYLKCGQKTKDISDSERYLGNLSKVTCCQLSGYLAEMVEDCPGRQLLKLFS